MTPTHFFVTLAFPFGTILLIFGMKYFAAIQSAKAAMANDEAYRKLADRAAAAEAESAAALVAIKSAMADLGQRVGANRPVCAPIPLEKEPRHA